MVAVKNCEDLIVVAMENNMNIMHSMSKIIAHSH
jgi:hypothetical protein